MLKVLIVDDEEITREGLRSCIPWEELGMEVVAEAEDGAKGLEAAVKLQPDIALCDVRMPHLDGIGLAKGIKDKVPGCKIIFLSGYSDVEYLRSAIQLQAIDYVEKPVDLDKLQEVLVKAAEACRQERENRERLEDMERQMIKSRPFLSGKALQALLAGTGSVNELEKEWLTVHSISSGDARYVCCMIMGEDRRLNMTLIEKLEEMFRSYGLEGLCCEYDHVLAAVFKLADGKENETIVLMMNSLSTYARNVLHTRLSAGVGGTVGSLEAIIGSVQQASEALQFSFYRGWNTTILHERTGRGAKPKLIHEKITFLQFEKHLQRQEFEEASILLQEVVLELRKLESPSIEWIRKRLFKFYIILSKVFLEAITELDNDELWRLFANGQLDSIAHFLQGQLEAIRDGLAHLGTQSDKAVIREAVAFIHNHYHEELSIDMIAKQVFLTPTYFCLIFKKELGIAVNEYITQVRIEKAKQLLKDRSLKLYEISLKVGYSDSNYFAKVFRKLTGFKPSEYREVAP